MEVHTYMLYVGSGKNEADNRAAITVSAEKIVETSFALELIGPDGKKFALLTIEPTLKKRRVGE